MDDPRVVIVAVSLATLLGAIAYAQAHNHAEVVTTPTLSFDRQQTTLVVDGTPLECTIQGVLEDDQVVSITLIDCQD